jgi:hypothetical protein
MYLNLFKAGQALPLDKSRFPCGKNCCANVAPDVAMMKRIRVACHVALDVASNIVALVRLLSANVLRSRYPHHE